MCRRLGTTFPRSSQFQTNCSPDTKKDCWEKRAITDVHTWPLAWNLLMELTTMFPDRVSKFTSYQDHIVTAGQRYQVEAWYNYDKTSRSQLANEPWRRWNTVDQNLWAFWFTGRFLPLCSTCNKYSPAHVVPSDPRLVMGKKSAGVSTMHDAVTLPSTSMPTSVMPVKASSLQESARATTKRPAATAPLLEHQTVSSVSSTRLQWELRLHPDRDYVRNLSPMEQT